MSYLAVDSEPIDILTCIKQSALHSASSRLNWYHSSEAGQGTYRCND